LLQLSTIDLQQEIQLLVESNPMLEATPNENKEEFHSQEVERKHTDELYDFQWSELYQSSNKRSIFENNDSNLDNLHCTTTNLNEHLLWQLALSPMSDVDRVIAAMIIDAVNPDGFLTTSVAELHASLTSDEHPLDLEEIEAVRHRVQYFDPVG